jgi:hypothetical protein
MKGVSTSPLFTAKILFRARCRAHLKQMAHRLRPDRHGCLNAHLYARQQRHLEAGVAGLLVNTFQLVTAKSIIRK